MGFQFVGKDGRRFSIRGYRTTIGRNNSNSIVIAERAVSRFHASLIVKNGRCWIQDNNSKLGVYVNHRRIESQVELKVGDIVRIGKSQFRLILKNEDREVQQRLVFIGMGAIILILLVVLLAFGNRSNPSNLLALLTPNYTTAHAFMDQYGFVAAFTGDEDYGALAMNRDGETLVAITDGTAESVQDVTGAVWTAPDGNTIIVHLGPDGLPERAIIRDYIFLFSNYSDDSVDLAIIAPDGSVEVARDVPIDPSLISAMVTQFGGTPHEASPNIQYALGLAKVMRYAATGINIVGCALSLGTVPETLGLTAPIAAASCASALLNVVTLFNNDPELRDFSSDLDASLCLTPVVPLTSAADCIAFWLDMTAEDIEESEEVRQRLDAYVVNAREKLAGTFSSLISLGSGDVQANLRWSTLDDLDLHVIDPYGNEIYYAVRSSPSGGELDIDANAGCARNITSSPVENIYWPRGGAPSGEYIIRVVFFANCGSQDPIAYELLLQVDGRVKSYSGYVDSVGEADTVTSFSR